MQKCHECCLSCGWGRGGSADFVGGGREGRSGVLERGGEGRGRCSFVQL